MDSPSDRPPIPNTPADDESDLAEARDLFIGPIPIELLGLYEKLKAAGWPMELVSL
jgi:hypothetical protein